jgi:predicted AlkP superfamily pyrophosphatase or phosphodiesterase
MTFTRWLMAATMMVATPALAQTRAPETKPPRLVVAISVDQFSSDLFAEWRGKFSGGMKRMTQGVVFPGGYQSHAATETCPGHSTILSGVHPGRAGIAANDWFGMRGLVAGGVRRAHPRFCGVWQGSWRNLDGGPPCRPDLVV